jgi:hypothetical protein
MGKVASTGLVPTEKCHRLELLRDRRVGRRAVLGTGIRRVRPAEPARLAAEGGMPPVVTDIKGRITKSLTDMVVI